MIDRGEELDDIYKYARTGYVGLGRQSDHVLAAILAQFPGDARLPMRWHYRDLDSFLSKHGHLGTILWASASSSHLLIINGHKIMRVWTDTAKHCYVDLSDNLAAYLHAASFCKMTDIPVGNVRKCKPFTKRIRIWQKHQAESLVAAIRSVYGLDNARLPLRVWT